MKNNKVISKIATMVIVMAVLALVVAKLYDIATHRPSLAYRQLSPQTIQWLNLFTQGDPESIIKAAPVGPFNWSNKEDIGQSRKMGKWGKEEDATTVVYYRKTRDAQDQIRARRVLECVDNILLEIPDYLSAYKGPDSLNGRKIAVYLPSAPEEYELLLKKLCDDMPAGGSQLGRSIISIGPLGCQCKGIILHPDAFQNKNAGSDPEYIRILRRELAYYTYMANLDYNQPTQRPSWFVQGIAVHFSLDGKRLPSFTPELVQRIEQECALDAEFPAKNKLNQVGGTSFIQFYEQTFGRMALTRLIETTYAIPVDSALCQTTGMDLVSLKDQWMEYLRADQLPDQNATTY